MIKRLLGLEPKKNSEGAYSPSPLALKLATSATKDYVNTDYPYQHEEGKFKILMVCTEERNMTMKNGKQFSTGNHPVEMLVPMLHFQKAGFDIDVFTPTGKSAKIEMWAFPEEDENVKTIYSKYKERFEKPRSLSDFVAKEMVNSSNYIAVFIPGGHGAMLGLPENEDLNKLIYWSRKNDMYMLSICHGPAALLAANLNNSKDQFLYNGYKMAAFPDSVDKQTPMIGYMPGHMPWKFREKLTDLGVEIVNKKADKTCYKDRELITGASPDAANVFGKLCTTELIKKVTAKY